MKLSDILAPLKVNLGNSTRWLLRINQNILYSWVILYIYLFTYCDFCTVFSHDGTFSSQSLYFRFFLNLPTLICVLLRVYGARSVKSVSDLTCMKHCRRSCLPTGPLEVQCKLQGIVGGLAYQDTAHARCHDCSLACWSNASVCCQQTAGSSPRPRPPQKVLHQRAAQ